MASRLRHDPLFRDGQDHPAARGRAVYEAFEERAPSTLFPRRFYGSGRERGDFLSEEVCRRDLVHESHAPCRRSRHLTPAEHQVQGRLDPDQSGEPGRSSPCR